MQNDNYKKFEVETERSVEMLEQAVLTMQQFGGDIDMFSYTMLRASMYLFAEVRGFSELERALPHLLHQEQRRRQPCGSA